MKAGYVTISADVPEELAGALQAFIKSRVGMWEATFGAGVEHRVRSQATSCADAQERALAAERPKP